MTRSHVSARLRYDQPTRARDVLRYVGLCMLVEKPAPGFVERVRRPIDAQPRCLTMADVEARVAPWWHDGGNPGSYLKQALVLLGREELLR